MSRDNFVVSAIIVAVFGSVIALVLLMPAPPDLKQACRDAGGVVLPDPNGKRAMWRCALPGEARP